MLINPAFVFIFVWSLALFLYTRYYSKIFLTLSDYTLTYIFASMFSVFCAWLFFVFWTGKLHLRFYRTKPMPEFTNSTIRKIKVLLVMWGGLSLVEILYFRDLPILAVFGLGSITYQEFGIPSLHGLLNAIILSISMYVLYYFLKTKNNKYLFFYCLTLLVPIIGMNRGGLTSLLVQSVFVVLVFRGVNAKLLFKFVLAFFVFVYLFGWLGEIRTVGLGNHVYDVFNISDNYPTWLPKEAIWVYMYLTSSLNNIENVISSYPLVNFEPYKALFGLLPTVLRDALPTPVTVDLVVPAFNVSSFMPNYLSAFGVLGSIAFYFLASLFPMFIYYKYIETRSFAYGFTLVILLHSIALSVFSDFFAIQVYVFQMVLQFIIFKKLRLTDV